MQVVWIHFNALSFLSVIDDLRLYQTELLINFWAVFKQL